MLSRKRILLNEFNNNSLVKNEARKIKGQMFGKYNNDLKESK